MYPFIATIALLALSATIERCLQIFSLTTMTLLGRHELDATVAVPVVVPANELSHAMTGLPFGGEDLAWVIRPVFDCAEQQFPVQVVVAEP